MRGTLIKKIRKVARVNYINLYNMLLQEPLIYRIKFIWGVVLKKKNPKFVIIKKEK